MKSVYPAKTLRFYGNRDPRDLLWYPRSEVAKAASVSIRTIHRWYPTAPLMTFRQLVEAMERSGRHADRIERAKDGSPLQVFPAYRDEPKRHPRLVAINPLIRFGQATIAKTGIPTWIIASMFRAGDSAALLAKDYDQPRWAIEAALIYERAITESR